MNGMTVSSARGAICSAIEGHCASMGPAAISMRQSNAMASSCSTTKSGVVGPALCSVENGLDALIETQQPCGEVVRRRYGNCVVGGHIEAAGVFHRVTLSLARVRRQSGA